MNGSLLALNCLGGWAFVDGACFQEILEECPVVDNCFAEVFGAGFAARRA